MMKKTKKNKALKFASGVQYKVNKDLDKLAGKVLFPEKLEKANRMLKGVKVPS